MEITSNQIKAFFHPRAKEVNKGSFGRVTILGGCKEFSGAPLITSLAYAAFKMGVGYATLAIPEELFSVYALRAPEIPLFLFPSQDGKILFNEQSCDQLLKNNRVLCIGMGLGQSIELSKTIDYFIHHSSITLVLDADALNILSTHPEWLLEKKCPIVLTPHLKEFSRLTHLSVEEIQKDKLHYALEFAKKYQVVLVLKDFETIITDGSLVYINKTGCPGLAKAGSGDCLSGIITGCVSEGTNILESCSIACHLFGEAAEKTSKDLNDYCMLSTDVVSHLAETINNYIK
jgi:hydroxyethylthiazole kinase-like uncharacterized protein yjeF